MAWITGEQEKPPRRTSREEIERQRALVGFLDEDKARLELYSFLKNNVSIAAHLLMGVDLFPYQHILMQANLKNDYVLNVMGRGSGKSFISGVMAGLYALFNPGCKIGILAPTFRQCLDENSYVVTGDGLKLLKDVVIGEKALSRHGLNTVKDKWKNPVAKGLKITTKRNYSLGGKIGHRVMRLDTQNAKFEYVNVEELKRGDYLVISPNGSFGNADPAKEFFDSYKPPVRSKTLNFKTDADLLYFIGLLWGDGYIDMKRGRFVLTSEDDEIIQFFKNYVARISSNQLSVSERNKDGHCKSLEFSSVIFRDFVKFLGVDYSPVATNKHIPPKILSLSKKNIGAFLSGLADTDGTVHKFKNSKGMTIDICTSSKQMSEQVHLLYLQFGIVSTRCTEKARGDIKIMNVSTIGRESYKVRICDRDGFVAFREHIGFRLSRKAKIVQDFLDNCGRKTSKRYLPEMGKYVHKKYNQSHPWGTSELNKKHTLAKETWLRRLKNGMRFLSPDDRAALKELASNNFFFDTVEDIETVDKMVTYDIEVENEHCYWGQGFINHNSKRIFQYLEEISEKKGAELFRQCIQKIEHKNDEWIMHIGKSKIYALPLGDGEKLRGFRFHCILIDELLLMPERVINEVIIPFLGVVQNPVERRNLRLAEEKLMAAGKLDPKNRYVWPNNKLIGLSSASYAFEYLYELYKVYEKLICGQAATLDPEIVKKLGASGSATRTIVHLSYEAIPSDIYDQSALIQAQSQMSESQFDREFRSRFTDDSSGYFKMSKMAACTIPDGSSPTIEVKGDPNAKYLLSFDPSWAENETSDDFAMHVFKLNEETKTSTLVHSYAVAGAKLSSHISYMLYLIKNFNIVMMCGDYNGGVQFVNACNESKEFKDSRVHLGVMVEEFDQTDDYQSSLMRGKQEYNLLNRKYVCLRKPSTDWIRKANELLQANIDHKRIWFAARCFNSDYQIQIKASIPIDEIEFRTKTVGDKNELREESVGPAKQIDFVEHLANMIVLTKAQSALIQVRSSSTGTQVFDLPENLKRQSGSNRTRKDSYAALVLGNWGVGVWFDLENYQAPSSDWVPSFA